MPLSALQKLCSQNMDRCANPAPAMHGVACSVCPAPRGESNGVGKVGCFRALANEETVTVTLSPVAQTPTLSAGSPAEDDRCGLRETLR